MTASSRCGSGYVLLVAALASASACLPEAFDALEEAAPVSTTAVHFPGQADAEIVWARTVPADDEGRGRVLFMDDGPALGWLRIDEAGHTQLRFASFLERAELGLVDAPVFSGIAVVEGTGVAEGLVRVVGDAEDLGRVVRFRVADFSRPSPAELDMRIYPWVQASGSALTGPLAAVELDDPAGADLPEALTTTSAGELIIWDALGTRALAYAAAREAILVDDPQAFDGDQAPQGDGLTRCADTPAVAIAGGRLLDDRGVAALLLGDAVRFVGRGEPAQTSLIGAPIYDCALATLSLPGVGGQLLVADVDEDGDEDLLVGAPTLEQVWIYRNRSADGDGGEGIDVLGEPDRILRPDPAEQGDFGATLAWVEIGGDAPTVLVVGAAKTRVGGKTSVGRVHVFTGDGERLGTIADLEPRTDSRHGLGVHGLDLPGREELAITGSAEIRVHWRILAGDPRP